ncbi:MAG: hypothetical protein JOY60_17800 [Burkholderiaceae bacterium]|nr:hypothetical protein [Burkholderiaceae bacterium]
MNKHILRGLLAVGALVSAGGAMAQTTGTVDTSAITAAGTTVATVGAAVFAVYVGIKVWAWVRRAL